MVADGEASTPDIDNTCLVCSTQCKDPEEEPTAAASMACLRCERWAHFGCAGLALPDGVVINMEFLHFVCQACEPLVEKAVKAEKEGLAVSDSPAESKKLSEMSKTVETLASSIVELIQDVKKLKFPTTTATPISQGGMEEQAEIQQRKMNVVMSFVPIDTDVADGGVGEAEKFFQDNFGVSGGDRGLIESVEPIGDPDRHMTKIKFKNVWKKSQIIRMAPTKLQHLSENAPDGRKPHIKPDYSFLQRQERKRLGDEVRGKPGGFAKYKIERGVIVER